MISSFIQLINTIDTAHSLIQDLGLKNNAVEKLFKLFRRQVIRNFSYKANPAFYKLCKEREIILAEMSEENIILLSSDGKDMVYLRYGDTQNDIVYDNYSPRPPVQVRY